MPYFSIVMPTLNRAHLLPPTIASIEAQRFTDYEILLVDGGSTDNTIELAPKLSPKLRVIHQPPDRKGIAAQRSTGFAEAKGEYIACLDSDDTMFPWTLETYRTAIKQFNEPAFMLADGLMFWKEEKLVEAKEIEPKFSYYPQYFDFLYKPRVGLSVCSGCVMKTEFARQVMGLSDKIVYAEDSDMFLKLGDRPGFVRIERPLTFGYRQHDSNVSVDFDRFLRGMGQLIAEESAGRYPGGEEFSRARRSELTTLLRSAAKRCLNRGRIADGWRIYRQSLAWNMQCQKWAFLGMYPFMMAKAALKGKKPQPAPVAKPAGA